MKSKTFLRVNKMPKTDKELYKAVMEIKSIIDTIREKRPLDNYNDLSYVSDHLDRYLDILEEQDPSLLGENT